MAPLNVRIYLTTLMHCHIGAVKITTEYRRVRIWAGAMIDDFVDSSLPLLFLLQ
jgi:hypothetical protein